MSVFICIISVFIFFSSAPSNYFVVCKWDIICNFLFPTNNLYIADINLWATIICLNTLTKSSGTISLSILFIPSPIFRLFYETLKFADRKFCNDFQSFLSNLIARFSNNIDDFLVLIDLRISSTPCYPLSSENSYIICKLY